VKLEDIPEALKLMDAEIDALNKMRDEAADKAKALAKKRGELFEVYRFCTNTNVPSAKAHMLMAYGIESAEKIGTPSAQ